MRQAVEETNWKVAAITAFAAMELALLKPAEAGPAWLAASAALTAALPLGVYAFSPLSRRGKWPPHIEPKKKSSVDDNLISAEELARFTHGELIFRLDKYLGGGITGTPYYEDIVGLILENAGVATRKRKLFKAACVVVGAGQVALLAGLL